MSQHPSELGNGACRFLQAVLCSTPSLHGLNLTSWLRLLWLGQAVTSHPAGSHFSAACPETNKKVLKWGWENWGNSLFPKAQ